MSSRLSLRVPFLLILSTLASAAFSVPLPAASPSSPQAGARCSTPRSAGLAALERQIFGPPLQGPTRVGEEVELAVRSPEIQDAATGESRLVWSRALREPGATYIAPHFSHFDLPPGAALVVRSPGGERRWRFQGTGKGTLGLTEGFWGIHIPGSTALLELWADGPVREGAVVVDRFARGIATFVPNEAICGDDDSQWARCLETTEPTVYEKSRAVARLLINGVGACTGWLVGDTGHLLTNWHCLGTPADAINADYEFMAEGATCDTDCATLGACPGTVAATSATFIQTSPELDYTLVRLPTNVSTTYGSLQLRPSGAVLEEQIYVPGHPAGWGKQIAFNSTDPADGSGRCEIYSLDEPPCLGGPGDVGYFCDTRGGSSGSPVLASADHLVVSLHHCALCPNRGVPIQAVIEDLGANLPPSAIGGSCVLPPPPDGVVASAAGPSQINVFWSAVPGATLYKVFRATTSGGPYTLAGSTTGTSFADTGRACDRTYYYVVRAATGSCPSENSDEVTVATTPCAPCTLQPLYENGFETGSGLADWTVGAFGGTVNTADWRGIQTCPARTGSNIFRFGGTGCDDGFYTDENFSYAQPGGSAGIAVPAGTANTRLTFWHRRDFEVGFDGATLAVSVDGVNYTFVPPSAIFAGTGFNGNTLFDCPPAPEAAGVPVFTGTDTDFTQTVVDLDAVCQEAAGTSCAGQSVRVAFTAITDCIVSQTGWYLDDVSVTTCNPTPLPAGETDYYTIAPCRLIDTRNAHGPLGGPALQPWAERAFAVAGACGVPSTARALAINLTAVQPAAAGYLQVYAGDTAPPPTSSINFAAGQIRANNAIVSLASDGTTTFKARAATSGALHFIVDVVGYFESSE